MKKCFYIFAAVLISNICFANQKLFDAIAAVESEHKSDVIGDSGKAVGKFQIHKEYVDDVNRILGGNVYSYNDRYDTNKSQEMVKIYLTFYGKLYVKKTGKSVTYEVLARIHNGGPNGYKKSATLKYWNKVKRVL